MTDSMNSLLQYIVDNNINALLGLSIYTLFKLSSFNLKAEAISNKTGQFK